MQCILDIKFLDQEYPTRTHHANLPVDMEIRFNCDPKLHSITLEYSDGGTEKYIRTTYNCSAECHAQAGHGIHQQLCPNYEAGV